MKKILFCLWVFVGLLYSNEKEVDNELPYFFINPFYGETKQDKFNELYQNSISDLSEFNEIDMNSGLLVCRHALVENQNRQDPVIKCDFLKLDSSIIFDVDSDEYRYLTSSLRDVSLRKRGLGGNIAGGIIAHGIVQGTQAAAESAGEWVAENIDQKPPRPPATYIPTPAPEHMPATPIQAGHSGHTVYRNYMD